MTFSAPSSFLECFQYIEAEETLKGRLVPLFKRSATLSVGLNISGLQWDTESSGQTCRSDSSFR